MWTEGVSNGGLPVIDYRINMGEWGTYHVIASGVTSNSYVITHLTPGTTYSFTVEARNSEGYSYHSEELWLLAASVPGSTYLSTVNLDDTIWFSWRQPESNGSPIT